MGEWANVAFERLQKIEGANHEHMQRAAQIRAQILANAPHLWKDIVGVFRDEIEDFSSKRPNYLSMEIQGGFVTLDSPQMYIEVTFDSQSPRLTYEVWKRRRSGNERMGQGSYTFRIYEGDVWPFDNKEKLRSTSEVAENILDWLIQEDV